MNKHVIDAGRYITESFLWEAQRLHYKRAGPFIWGITNSCTTALYYAKAILAFLRDRQEKLSFEHPVYVLDLGAGAGRFAYLLTRHLRQLLAETPFANLQICVVLVDHASEYARWWQENPLLNPLMQQGWIDFAEADLADTQSIYLSHQKISLTPDVLVNPLIAIGNYLFDQIPCEAFLKRGEGAVRGKWQLTSHNSGITQESLLNDFSHFHEVECRTLFDGENLTEEDPLPFDSELCHFLHRCLSDFEEGTPFYFPWTSLEVIRLLKKLSEGRLLFLCGDMGERDLAGIKRQEGDLALVIMASLNLFALPVNFPIITKYVETQNGWYRFSRASQRRFAILALGFEKIASSHLDDFLNGETGSGYPLKAYHFINALKKKGVWLSIEMFLSALEMSHYDPGVLARSTEDVSMQIMAGYEADYPALAQALIQVGKNLFWAEKGDGNIALKLAQLYYILGLFDRAVNCLLRTLQLCGPSEALYYYLGLSYEGMGEKKSARQAYLTLLKINPEHLQARCRLEKIYIEMT